MRYLAPAAAVTLLAAIMFASCTCHKQVESPLGDSSPHGFEVVIAATATVPTRVQETPPTESPVTPTPMKVAEPRPSPTRPESLPPDYPSDLPAIPGSTLAQVQDMANDAHNVIFTSEKPVPELARTFDESMRRTGWRVTQKFERDRHAFATYEKGSMLINVTIASSAENPGQQDIAVMYEDVKPLEFEEDEDAADE